MKKFVSFMVNAGGRTLRIVAGLALIVIGAFVTKEMNWVLIIVGLIPLSAGVFDFCLLASLMGYYFSGKRTREMVSQ